MNWFRLDSLNRPEHTFWIFTGGTRDARKCRYPWELPICDWLNLCTSHVTLPLKFAAFCRCHFAIHGMFIGYVSLGFGLAVFNRYLTILTATYGINESQPSSANDNEPVLKRLIWWSLLMWLILVKDCGQPSLAIINHHWWSLWQSLTIMIGNLQAAGSSLYEALLRILIIDTGDQPLSNTNPSLVFSDR